MSLGRRYIGCGPKSGKARTDYTKTRIGAGGIYTVGAPKSALQVQRAQERADREDAYYELKRKMREELSNA